MMSFEKVGEAYISSGGRSLTIATDRETVYISLPSLRWLLKSNNKMARLNISRWNEGGEEKDE